MGQRIINIDRHNDNVLRAAIMACGGDATVQEVKKCLYYSDEATFRRAVKFAPSVREGGKGLVAR